MRVVLLAALVGACSAFGSSDTNPQPPAVVPPGTTTDAGQDASSSSGSDSGQPVVQEDGGLPVADSGTPLNCSDAIFCDDFERSSVPGPDRNWSAFIGMGGTVTVLGAFTAMVPTHAGAGPGPDAYLRTTLTTGGLAGAVRAEVDLDLNVNAGAVRGGYTNLLRVALDGSGAQIILYLDGAGNLQAGLGTANGQDTTDYYVNDIEPGSRHYKIIGEFNSTGGLIVRVDGSQYVTQAVSSRQVINDNGGFIELGPRVVGDRDRATITVDNLVVRATPMQ